VRRALRCTVALRQRDSCALPSHPECLEARRFERTLAFAFAFAFAFALVRASAIAGSLVTSRLATMRSRRAGHVSTLRSIFAPQPSRAAASRPADSELTHSERIWTLIADITQYAQSIILAARASERRPARPHFARVQLQHRRH
jgi:hypothetical protein